MTYRWLVSPIALFFILVNFLGFFPTCLNDLPIFPVPMEFVQVSVLILLLFILLSCLYSALCDRAPLQTPLHPCAYLPATQPTLQKPFIFPYFFLTKDRFCSLLLHLALFIALDLGLRVCLSPEISSCAADHKFPA